MPGFHAADEYLKLPRSPSLWTVEPILPSGGKLNILGAPKKGKSLAALQMASAVADPDADDWLGFPIGQHGCTCFLQLDTPRSLWAFRVQQAVDFGLDLSKVHICDREEAPEGGFSATNPKHIDWLRGWVDQLEPVIVVIDTYRESFRRNENDSDIGQRVLTALTVATFPASLVLISHRGKPGENPRDLVDQSRGSSYLAGAVDGIMGVSNTSYTYISRMTEQHTIKLRRHTTGLWVPKETDGIPTMGAVMADTTLTSMRERARVVAEKMGWTEEKARYDLKKYLDQAASGGHTGNSMAESVNDVPPGLPAPSGTKRRPR